MTPRLRLQKRALDDPWEGSTWLNFYWVCVAGLSESLAHYSLIFRCFQIQIFFIFITLFQEFTMEKNYNTSQIKVKKHEIST